MPTMLSFDSLPVDGSSHCRASTQPLRSHPPHHSSPETRPPRRGRSQNGRSPEPSLAGQREYPASRQLRRLGTSSRSSDQPRRSSESQQRPRKSRRNRLTRREQLQPLPYRVSASGG